MKSKWFEYKSEVQELRRQGISMTVIERRYAIPRSTLSYWFKDIKLSDEKQSKLSKNSRDGWEKARISANQWHKNQKAVRLKLAKSQAKEVVDRLSITNDVLDLAFAMLYFGEGAKNNVTSIANSDPVILNFVLDVLERNYSVKRGTVKCDLHLRADQDGESMRSYWSKQLGIPLDCFKGIYYDKRTVGRATYDHYKGVCLIYCGPIGIQRKLINLYNLFCARVAETRATKGD